MSSKELELFDKQVNAFIEYEFKTEKMIEEIQSKIIRLNKCLKLKKNNLLENGVTKYKISRNDVFKKMVSAKMEFDNKKYFSDKDIQDFKDSNKKHDLKESTVKNESSECKGISLTPYHMYYSQFSYMLASGKSYVRDRENGIKKEILSNDDDDDMVLSQIDLSPYVVRNNSPSDEKSLLKESQSYSQSMDKKLGKNTGVVSKMNSRLKKSSFLNVGKGNQSFKFNKSNI